MYVPDNQFIEYLVAQGAEILDPTNEWEVVRFKSKDGIGIVYKNKRGDRKYTGEAFIAVRACSQKDLSWNVTKSKRKPVADKVLLLIARDGLNCFYCGNPTTEENRNVEHLLSVADGGNNRLPNLALTHHECNAEAGRLDIVSKVKLREEKLHTWSPSNPPIPKRKNWLQKLISR